MDSKPHADIEAIRSAVQRLQAYAQTFPPDDSWRVLLSAAVNVMVQVLGRETSIEVLLELVGKLNDDIEIPTIQ